MRRALLEPLLGIALGLERLLVGALAAGATILWVSLLPVRAQMPAWVLPAHDFFARVAVATLAGLALAAIVPGLPPSGAGRPPGSRLGALHALACAALAMIGSSAARPLFSAYGEAAAQLEASGTMARLRSGFGSEMGGLFLLPALPPAVMLAADLAPLVSLVLVSVALLAAAALDRHRLGRVALLALVLQGTCVADALFARSLARDLVPIAARVVVETKTPAGDAAAVVGWLERHRDAADRSARGFLLLFAIQAACVPLALLRAPEEERWTVPGAEAIPAAAGGEPPAPAAVPEPARTAAAAPAAAPSPAIRREPRPVARSVATGTPRATGALFLRRAQALALDAVLVFLVAFLVAAAIRRAAGLPGPDASEYGGTEGWGLVFLLFALLGWAYWSGLESSAWQATLGKRLFGLRVVGRDGAPISFARATLRHVVRVASGLLWGVGFLLALVTPQRQALHDLVAGSVVEDTAA